MDINMIINKLKLKKNLKNDNKVADFLDITPSLLANWKARKAFDYEKILLKCHDMDLNWLLLNQPEQSSTQIERLRELEEILPVYKKLASNNEELYHKEKELSGLLRQRVQILEQQLEICEKKNVKKTLSPEKH